MSLESFGGKHCASVADPLGILKAGTTSGEVLKSISVTDFSPLSDRSESGLIGDR